MRGVPGGSSGRDCTRRYVRATIFGRFCVLRKRAIGRLSVDGGQRLGSMFESCSIFKRQKTFRLRALCPPGCLLVALQSLTDRGGDRRVHRQREMPDSGDAYVHGVEVGVVDAGRPDRDHHLVQLAPEADEPGPAARGRAGAAPRSAAEPPRICRTMGCSAGQRGDGGAAVRGAERDEGAHPVVAAQALYVVAGDQAAEAVARRCRPRAARCGRRSPRRGGRAARRRCGCRRSAASS